MRLVRTKLIPDTATPSVRGFQEAEDNVLAVSKMKSVAVSGQESTASLAERVSDNRGCGGDAPLVRLHSCCEGHRVRVG